jgi:hypothetical protein
MEVAMKIFVRGQNYTGANFRGIPDETDGQLCDLILNGDEVDIVDFILDNFDWGRQDDIKSIAVLIDKLKREELGQFEGAGGVLYIRDAESNVLYVLEDIESFENDDVLILGEVKAKHPVSNDTVNHMVDKVIEARQKSQKKPAKKAKKKAKKQ